MNQVCIYWGNPRNNVFGGQDFDFPVFLNCRWEDKQEEMMSDDGETFSSKARIWVPMDVAPGGYLFLNEGVNSYTSDTVPQDPTSLRKAYPIKKFCSIPDLRNVEVERMAYL